MSDTKFRLLVIRALLVLTDAARANNISYKDSYFDASHKELSDAERFIQIELDEQRRKHELAVDAKLNYPRNFPDPY